MAGIALGLSGPPQERTVSYAGDKSISFSGFDHYPDTAPRTAWGVTFPGCILAMYFAGHHVVSLLGCCRLWGGTYHGGVLAT